MWWLGSIYLFIFLKGFFVPFAPPPGFGCQDAKICMKNKSRTHNFCIQCLRSKKVWPVHRHQVPIGSQQHKRMLDFIFYFHMLFSQIWLNHLVDDQSLLGSSIFFMGDISPKCEEWFWMFSFTRSEGKKHKNWHQIQVEGWLKICSL
jgi:hypothetical protein